MLKTITRTVKEAKPPTTTKKGKKSKPRNDKTVTASVSKSVRKIATKVPRMSQKFDATVIEHSEYITDITSANVNFAVTPLPLNPGISKTFPWLATVATQFESYKFEFVEISYKPVCPTSTPGVISIAVDYDAADAAPTSKAAINSYAETASSSVWDITIHKCKKINMNKFGPQRYVRGITLPSGTDIKTYDTGTIYVSSSNTPATQTQLGEVWIKYRVRLYTPQITTSSLINARNTPPAAGSWQSMILTKSAENVITFVGEFMNNPVVAIGKITDQAAAIIVDFIYNPALYSKTILNMLSYQAGVSFGVGPDFNASGSNNWLLSRALTSGPSSEIMSIENYNYDDFNTIASRMWYSCGNPTAQAVNKAMPHFRLSIPKTAIAWKRRMNFTTLDIALPNANPWAQSALATTVPSVTVDPIAWNTLSGQFATSTVRFQQTSIDVQPRVVENEYDNELQELANRIDVLNAKIRGMQMSEFVQI